MASPQTARSNPAVAIDPLADVDAVPTRSWTLAGVVRLTLRALAIVLLILVCVPLHVLQQLTGRPPIWPRRFLAAVGWACGARVVTRGDRVERRVFHAANHTSWLDIPVIAGATGCAFVAKDGIADWPVVGWLCRINRTIFVSREKRGNVAETIDTMRDAMREGYPITVFPEGTTSNGDALLPFKPSLFAALYDPPFPILVQPIHVSYAPVNRDVAWVGNESPFTNLLYILSRQGNFPVTLNFLEPFDPQDTGDRKAIRDRAESQIAAALCASQPAVATV